MSSLPETKQADNIDNNNDSNRPGSSEYWNPMQEYILSSSKLQQNGQTLNDPKSNDGGANKESNETVPNTGNKDDNGDGKADSEVSKAAENEVSAGSKDENDVPKDVETNKEKEDDQNKSDIKTEDAKSNQNEETESTKQTENTPKAPDPLRDNFTSNRTKTHVVEEPKSIQEKSYTNTSDNTPSLESVATSFVNRIDQIEDDNQQLLDDNKRLLESLKRINDDSAQINGRIKIAEDHVQEVTSKNNTLQAKNDDLSSQVEKLKKENETLAKVVHDSAVSLKVQAKEFETDKDQWDQKLEDAYSMIKSLEGQVETLNEIKQKSESKISELEGKNSSTSAEVESKVASLHQKIEQLQQSNTQFKVDLDEAEEENDKLLINLEKLREAEKQQHLLKSKQDQDNSDLHSVLQSKEELCETLEQETISLTEQLEKYKSKVEQLENAISTMETTLKQQEVEIVTMEKDRDSLENKLIKKENEGCSNCDSLQKEIRRLMRKNADQKEWLDTLRLSSTSVTELSKQKQEYLAELQKDILQLRIENTALKNEVTKLKATDTPRDIEDIHIEQINSTHKRVLEENHRLKTLHAHHTQEEMDAISEKEDLQGILVETKAKLVKANTRIKKLEKLIDEIYENVEFQHFMQTEASSTRSEVLSLPDINISNTPRYPNTGRPSYVSSRNTGRISDISTYRSDHNRKPRNKRLK